LLTLFRLVFSSRITLVAENLFLRKQLALFQERRAKPRRTTASIRLAMIALAKLFDWREALVIVQPETFVKWHRAAFKIYWRWKARKLGRPALPRNLRALIQRMARENVTWGEERIADELSVKLGIRVSPRTVRRYLDCGGPRTKSGQRWNTFVRNHAQAMVACDFFVSIWDLELRSHSRPRFRQVHTDTNCRASAALHQGLFSAVCITNIGWRRRPREAGLNFCGGQCLRTKDWIERRLCYCGSE
jgi:hypothetical protein